ncbi:Por secretion system C-terminal sorting domain-containing protein [Dyadobacter soli]|uniref:Por secretion system C-terminal sorting domain-containing protein n=1 Tax=Dyadobacter soli TaxID=659014 RepID=A0A1G7VCB9_9BACT|nr:T9SS type A sorting domain-containing protein [Dyadobacter soli]SDG57367.1 Por secretion system C-terminal sorting domain-containing protein [Dyadobacter soli]
MKALLLIMTALYTLHAINVTACPGGNFTTQASVDNFPINNPGCTVITGDVLIGNVGVGSNITNLNGFSAITRVIGNLSIFNNPSLTNLNGFSALKSVDKDLTADLPEYTGQLFLAVGPLVSDLSGLNALQRVQTLDIMGGLSSLNGLSSLIAVRTLRISDTKLVNLQGLLALDSCVSLSVQRNPLLTSLNGFPPSIPYLQDIELRSDPLLTSANIFNGVTALGRVDIDGLPMLADLSDFSQIQSFRAIWIGSGGINSFQGLNSCKSIGTLYVGGDYPGYEGLDNVTFIDFFYMRRTTNPAFRNFNGLGSLKTIRRWEVQGSFESFSGLTSLEVVNNIFFNGVDVPSLIGLENLNADSIQSVYIEGSFNLTQCSVKSMCTYLSNPEARAQISGGIGCYSREQILNSAECRTVLPVTLVSFEIKKVAEGNKLVWQTATEAGNKGFEIERSADGRVFTSIGFVHGNGDSGTLKSYSFTDALPLTNSYYRLKQWDWDGSFEYSKIVWVHANTLAAIAYPNPAQEFVYIRNAPNFSPISIQNMKGFSVHESVLLPGKPIDTKSLQNGLYMISVGNEQLKVWVQH